MAIPDITKAYLYGYEQMFMAAAKKLIKIEHPETKADKSFRKYNYKKAKQGYDDVYGEYLYYVFTIDNNKDDDIVWIDR